MEAHTLQPEQRARKRLMSVVERATRDLSVQDVEELAERIEQITQKAALPSSKTDLVRSLSGRDFTVQERLELEQLSLLQYFQRRRELLRDSLTASQVATILGTSRQTPHDRVKSGTLLAIQDRGALRFPTWQFDSQGPDGVVEGLPEVLRALHIQALSKLSWLVSPNQVLDGMTPIAALKRGQRARVVDLAKGVGAL